MASRCRSLRRRYCASIGVSFTPPSAATAARASDLLPLVAEVVDEEVFAQAIRTGVEGAAAVDACHLLDECPETRAVRSEERRVGKEWRWRGAPEHEKKKV